MNELKPLFEVIDKTTGKPPVWSEYVLSLGKNTRLIYCDISGPMIDEDGEIYLLDDCDNFEYLPAERFEICWNTLPTEGHPGVADMERFYKSLNSQPMWTDEEIEDALETLEKATVNVQEHHGIAALVSIAAVKVWLRSRIETREK